MLKLGTSNFSSVLILIKNQLPWSILVISMIKKEILFKLFNKYPNTQDHAFKVSDKLVFPILQKDLSFHLLPVKVT